VTFPSFCVLQFEYSEQLWPWSGYLALYIRVKQEGSDFMGTGSGEVQFTVLSPPGKGETAARHSVVKVPLTAGIIPTPHRWGLRVIVGGHSLCDASQNLRYGQGAGARMAGVTKWTEAEACKGDSDCQVEHSVSKSLTACALP
jgi:hypothetical protein